MLKSQKTMLVISERRQNQTELAEKVNASADGATEEQINQRSALAKDIATLETEYRGHLTDEAAEETRAFGDAEARERRALVAGCNIGAIFAATIDHRQTDGQVAELQESLNLAANQVPLELLETRAVTPAPGEVQASQAAIEPYVFPGSVAEFLAIPRPTVGVGEQVYPTLVGATTVHAPAKGGAAGETTGEFAAEKLSPARPASELFLQSRGLCVVCRHGRFVAQHLERSAFRWPGPTNPCRCQWAAGRGEPGARRGGGSDGLCELSCKAGL